MPQGMQEIHCLAKGGTTGGGGGFARTPKIVGRVSAGLETKTGGREDASHGPGTLRAFATPEWERGRGLKIKRADAC